MSSRSHSAPNLLAHHVIKSAVVTEKTTHVAERYNCFVIEVSVASTKPIIRRAVEESWGVRVLAVRTQMRVGKTARRKAIVGTSRPRKFAFVTLHSDDRLNFI